MKTLGDLVKEYYCNKCQKTVTPINGQFKHPDLGWKSCLVCPVCYVHVTPRCMV